MYKPTTHGFNLFSIIETALTKQKLKAGKQNSEPDTTDDTFKVINTKPSTS